MSESYDERANVTAAPGRLELVRTFLNTRDIENGIDALETSPGARRWLVAHDLLRRNAQVSERDRIQLIELREAVRALAFSHNGYPLPRRELVRLNRHAANASI